MSVLMRIAAAVLLSTAAHPAVAEDYPNRPIAMVVPFAAGGPGDVIGRLLATSFGKVLGQTVIIENVVGAGGTIGTNRVAKAAPDGYTLLLMHVGQATSVTLFRKLPYDPVGDFEPIGLVTDVPMVLVAPLDFPPKDFKETIAYVKATATRCCLGMQASARPRTSADCC
jgi:tripartite-type tricarboxylate transporter receptor subunit TctC